MSAFTTPLRVEFIDGKYWILLSPFTYRVGSVDSKEIIFVPAGFKTDFGSIWRLFWPVIGHPTGKYGKATVVHDYLYQHSGGRSRRRCDQVFLEGMKVLGVSWWRRTEMYSAVRVGGRGPWKTYRKQGDGDAGEIVG